MKLSQLTIKDILLILQGVGVVIYGVLAHARAKYRDRAEYERLAGNITIARLRAELVMERQRNEIMSQLVLGHLDATAPEMAQQLRQLLGQAPYITDEET